MEQENLVAGVAPGGFKDIYEVRILICYLLHSVSEPLTQEQLNFIFRDNYLVNYFTFTQAMAQLLEEEQITPVRKENEEYLVLNALGIETASLLQKTLPRSVRDTVISAALNLLSEQKKKRENEIITKRLENGFNVTFIIHEKKFELMRFSMFVPDETQLELIKKKFLADPSMFYATVVEYLTEEV